MIMFVKILLPFELPSELINTLCHYISLYGAQILLLAVLIAITIYRRELSVNHTYVEEEGDRGNGDRSGEAHQEEQFNAALADNLLEGAGNTFSGEPLMAFYSIWARIVALAVHEEALDSVEFSKNGASNWDDCSDLLEQVGSFCSGSVVKHVFQKNEQEALPYTHKRITWDDSEDLFEGAGNFCSGSVWAHLFLKSLRTFAISKEIDTEDAFTQGLPPDVQVQILSFLHPRDITVFACVSQSCQNVIDNGETSPALWRNIWKRDYAWIVESWNVGKEALLRSSLPDSFRFSKVFYFEFGISFMNYILAGHNTVASCLVGIHGDIFDLTEFMTSHPGSPDTLLVNSGRDATKYFEDMRHSLGARHLAKKLCILVDRACLANECGLHPTKITSLLPVKGLDVPLTVENSTIPFLLKSRRRPFALQTIRSKLDDEERQLLKLADRKYLGCGEVLNGLNLYYDPFNRKWKGWYTSTSFNTVFLDNI